MNKKSLLLMPIVLMALTGCQPGTATTTGSTSVPPTSDSDDTGEITSEEPAIPTGWTTE